MQTGKTKAVSVSWIKIITGCKLIKEGNNTLLRKIMFRKLMLRNLSKINVILFLIYLWILFLFLLPSPPFLSLEDEIGILYHTSELNKKLKSMSRSVYIKWHFRRVQLYRLSFSVFQQTRVSHRYSDYCEYL